MAVNKARMRALLTTAAIVEGTWLILHSPQGNPVLGILRAILARPPASDSGIGGYTGRAKAQTHSSWMPGGAPDSSPLPFRPSPVSPKKSDSGGCGGLSPRLNLILLQHRFTGVEG